MPCIVTSSASLQTLHGISVRIFTICIALLNRRRPACWRDHLHDSYRLATMHNHCRDVFWLVRDHAEYRRFGRPTYWTDCDLIMLINCDSVAKLQILSNCIQPVMKSVFDTIGSLTPNHDDNPWTWKLASYCSCSLRWAEWLKFYF